MYQINVIVSFPGTVPQHTASTVAAAAGVGGVKDKAEVKIAKIEKQKVRKETRRYRS